MPTGSLTSEAPEIDLASRVAQLQRALEREAEIARRQKLLKELWKLSQQRGLAEAEVCQT